MDETKLSPREREIVQNVMAHHPKLTFKEALAHLRLAGM
jgi:hypothetical protein